jgi:KUP system potassium uptake protein
VIASQALISGAFSLTRQAIQLGYLPRLDVRHTSSETEGQIYMGAVNWVLAVACLLLVLFFERSTRLAAAYGIAVTGTMAITSGAYFVVTRTRWGWPLWRALPLLMLFLSTDLLFFGSNLLKFVDGGYVPIVVASAIFVIMLVWRTSRRGR